jgi:hypothetical protein
MMADPVVKCPPPERTFILGLGRAVLASTQINGTPGIILSNAKLAGAPGESAPIEQLDDDNSVLILFSSLESCKQFFDEMTLAVKAAAAARAEEVL